MVNLAKIGHHEVPYKDHITLVVLVDFSNLHFLMVSQIQFE